MAAIKDHIILKKNSLLGKLFLTGFLILLFLIPLSKIGNLIQERSNYRSEAVNSISASWAGSQNFFGPVLAVPYTKKVEFDVYDHDQKKTVKKTATRRYMKTFLADTLKIKADMNTELRYRGIYEVPIYTAKLQIDADFASLAKERSTKKGKVLYGKPYLVFGLTDVRGIGADMALEWNGKTVSPEAGTAFQENSPGFHVPLDVDFNTMGASRFTGELSIKGANAIAIAPTGKNVTLAMESSWPHPRFDGQYLPSNRQITEKGFSADWQVGLLATNMEALVRQCADAATTTCNFQNTAFGVSFFQPVDIYQQTSRSVKYGILIILLTFTAFFVFETLQRLRIHPIQYLLVGSSLVVFYLLLLSLSEHIVFDAAYVIAVVATLGLLGFYLSHILRHPKVTAVLMGLLAMLYALVYIILVSRDFSLLLGTILIFVVLAVLMAITRRVNWYALDNTPEDQDIRPE